MSAANSLPKLSIRRIASSEEVQLCAQLMSTLEPWITLGRSYEESVRILEDPQRETYVAYAGESLVGFLVLIMSGALVGYIQTICVIPEARCRGIGAELMRFAEDRIGKDSPNVFLCVSSFNPRARRLYEKLGYKAVGELNDYVVLGHSEILMRKTRGPLRDFREAR